VGTYQDASGNDVVIYYYPYDLVTGDLELYYITVTDSAGTLQYTREAWPPNVISEEPSPTAVQPPTASSFLTGWDFPLNPFQFGASSAITPSPPAPGLITTTPGYIVDQTIAAAANIGGISWGSDPQSFGLTFGTTNVTDAFYIMQYLSGDTVYKMLGIMMSLNVFGYVVGGAAPVTMQIYLFRAPSTASIPTLPTTIGTVASNGVFTLTAAGWDAIPNSSGVIPSFTLSSVLIPTDINNVSNNYGFSGYQITNPTDVSNTALFAMVITFAYSGSTQITVNSVGLVPGEVPSTPSLQTPDEVLRECQYYYQKSFVGSQVPIDGSGSGATYGIQVSGASAANSAGPIITYQVTMRTSPFPVTLYNPIIGGPGQITTTGVGPWAASMPLNGSAKGFITRGTTPEGSFAGLSDLVNWTADARLGVLP
jgi:hypothetical protein